MYKSVLIGLGSIAWKLGAGLNSASSLNHKDAMDNNPNVKLVAGFSPDKNEVEEFINISGLKGYTDLTAMLEKEKPDLVSICSPLAFHAEQLQLCFDYQISMIWLEKPVASQTSEVESLETHRQAMQTPSTVLVNFQRRYTESYNRLKQILNKKTYGNPLAVEVHYSRGLEINGSHMMDMLAFLFSDSQFELVWVEQGSKHNNPDFIVRLKSQILVHVVGIESSFHNIDLSITFEQARLSIYHGGMTLKVEEVKENDLFPGYYRLYDIAPDALGEPGFDRAFDKALTDLTESYEQKRQPVSNLLTVLQGQKLVEDVLQIRLV